MPFHLSAATASRRREDSLSPVDVRRPRRSTQRPRRRPTSGGHAAAIVVQRCCWYTIPFSRSLHLVPYAEIPKVVIAPALHPVPSVEIFSCHPTSSPMCRDLRLPGHGSQERGLVLRATQPRSVPAPPARRQATGAGNAGSYSARRCEGALADCTASASSCPAWIWN